MKDQTAFSKNFLRFVFVVLPFALVTGIVFPHLQYGMPLSVAMLAGLNLFLIAFLGLVLMTENADNLPHDIGKVIRGPAYVMSIAGTLFLIIVFSAFLNGVTLV